MPLLRYNQPWRLRTTYSVAESGALRGVGPRLCGLPRILNRGSSEHSSSRTFVNRGKEKGRTLLLRSITVVAWHSHPVQAIVYFVVRRVVLRVLEALNEVISQSLDHRLRFASCHVLLLDVEVY